MAARGEHLSGTRLLLDEHISPRVVESLRRHEVDCISLRDWTAGPSLGASDDEILKAAARDRRVFVTFDVHTIPTLLKRWAEAGLRHAGVIFVSAKTVRPSDTRRLTRALRRIVEDEASDLDNEVLFLS